MKYKIKHISILPFIFLIKIYQAIGPIFIIKCCKFTPSCSQYTILALKKYGIIKGGLLSIKRILSCNPWNKKYGIQKLK